MSADRQARFESIARVAYEPLQRYVRRRTPLAEVDDAVADTLVVLWRRLDDVPVGFELAWCYGVARRCLANRRRSDERHQRLIATLVAEQPDETAGHDPAGDAELEAALRLLRPDDREVLQLWAWEQLEPREMALVLGVSPNAAAIRLHRAKRRLARRLGVSTEQEQGKDASPAGQSGVGHTEVER
ncbi:MAG TPA: sigma-70 family RNA polymerase sigma factor [Acidimicrobiales bacterium]